MDHRDPAESDATPYRFIQPAPGKSCGGCTLEPANNNDDWDEPDDDDNDEGEELMGKASVNEYLRTNDDANRPGKLPSSSHPSSSNSRHNGSDQIP
jgi:hypothetical protein